MLLRVVGIMSLASGLMFAPIGVAHAVPSTAASVVHPTAVSAPELDPAYVGGGIVILGGGLLLLAERHRKSKSS
jgi:hypothetical protein